MLAESEIMFFGTHVHITHFTS